MLTHSELATIRAALRYWSEEMGPAGIETARHYLDDESEPGLSAPAVERLSQRFAVGNVRYLICTDGKPVSSLLPAPPADPVPGQTCVTVILSADRPHAHH